MTIVERAAYLKGLTEGLGVDPDSRDGKLWGALTDLLSDMAHEIEDLQSGALDFADALDEIGDELGYLEELTGERGRRGRRGQHRSVFRRRRGRICRRGRGRRDPL